MTTSSPLRIGIAGLGRLGKRHASILARRTPGAELVAACSPAPEELEWARATLGVTSLYGDYRALLTQPGLDAVWLVTPTTLHPEQIVAALDAASTCSARSRCRSNSPTASPSRRRPRSIRGRR